MIEALIRELKLRFSGSVYENADLSTRTTFKIGGRASVLIEAESVSVLKHVLSLCDRFKIGFLVLGAGSNLLISDKGIADKVVISLNRLNSIKLMRKARVYAEAGAKLGAVQAFCACEGLSGLEWSVGIPASVGGACYMNAGAFSGDMGKVVESVTVLINGKICKWKRDKLFFNYRDSVFKSQSNCVIIGVLIKLEKSTLTSTRNKAACYIKRRLSTQNVGYPSAGSAFKRKGEEVVPARILDELNLRGLRVGSAEVSRVHAGYIVNTGGASSKDVLALIKLIQKTVFDELQIGLEPEIIIWGE